MATTAVAHADVMEISAGGHRWVSGEPAGPADITDPSSEISGPASASTPITHVAASAGPQRWQPRIAELAAKYDLSPALLEAVVWQESRWRESALSPAGARGLAQLMPGTARAMGINPDDPSANLEGGARYLRAQLDAFESNLEKALAAYNAGPRRVQEAGGVPAIAETRAYVAAIMARLANPVRR